MAWTPPSKFTVFLTFLLMAFGVFIVLDQSTLLWSGTILPSAYVIPGVSSFQFWLMTAAIVIFLSWFLFFLGVKMKGL
ncbi:MAG: hypothetical protein HWN80_06100 [Candidatus Lokiarchaeota archaeon]|nr:hypothetical protein [Candidatus Lokiarchaeota archaeon]